MGMATIPGNIKYVFTQEATPSGEGEVSGSLWYKPSTKVLSTYDGLAWNNVSIVSDSGEGHITIRGINYNAIIQGTWAIVSYPGLTAFGDYAWSNQGSSNINDELEYKIYLAKGTYTFRAITFNQSQGGIIHVRIDGTEVGTFDTYIGGSACNVVNDITSITVAGSGLVTLSVKVASKNGSASAYRFNFAHMALWRTA